MLFRIIMVLSLTLFPTDVLAEEMIDKMLAVVSRTVITQSDIQVLETLHQQHSPSLPILKKRAQQSQLGFLVELEIMFALAEGVPVYNIPPQKWKSVKRSLVPILQTEQGKIYGDRFLHWMQLQIIAENYVRTNLGVSPDNPVTIEKYIVWMRRQKKKVSYRIVPQDRIIYKPFSDN